MMTRKDFEVLAASVAMIPDATERDRMRQDIGNVCAASNPRFDWTRWSRACNVDNAMDLFIDAIDEPHDEYCLSLSDEHGPCDCRA